MPCTTEMFDLLTLDGCGYSLNFTIQVCVLKFCWLVFCWYIYVYICRCLNRMSSGVVHKIELNTIAVRNNLTGYLSKPIVIVPQ